MDWTELYVPADIRKMKMFGIIFYALLTTRHTKFADILLRSCYLFAPSVSCHGISEYYLDVLCRIGLLVISADCIQIGLA